MNKSNLEKQLVPLIYVCLGILLIAFSNNFDSVISTITTVLAIAIIVVAVFKLLSYFFTKSEDNIASDANGFIVGLSLAVVGVIIWLKGTTIAAIIPFIFGFMIAFKGIEGIQTVMNYRKQDFGPGKGLLISSLALLAVGIFLMINPFGWIRLLFIFLGISLIVTGIGNFLVNINVSKGKKIVSEANSKPYDDSSNM